MNIADGVRKFRDRHEYTQEGLAEVLSCSRASVARWEAGTKTPSAVFVLQMCAIDPDFPALCSTVATTDIFFK